MFWDRAFNWLAMVPITLRVPLEIVIRSISHSTINWVLRKKYKIFDKAKKLGNWLSEYHAQFKDHFDMSHDYGGPKFYRIVKHEQPGTGFWPMIPITIWHQTFVGRITIWTDNGLEQ